MGMTCPTDEQMDVYCHAMFTSDMTWDPSHFGDDDDTIKVTDPVPTNPRVNQFGEGLGWEHHETYSLAFQIAGHVSFNLNDSVLYKHAYYVLSGDARSV
jgi:hypothetical protein